ncbi:hypothetical protein G9A89_023898 [Geosiphon pyriformis]|nr:hypothetical protein G9A89_023898 [Geosiphon pyriformis]
MFKRMKTILILNCPIGRSSNGIRGKKSWSAEEKTIAIALKPSWVIATVFSKVSYAISPFIRFSTTPGTFMVTLPILSQISVWDDDYSHFYELDPTKAIWPEDFNQETSTIKEPSEQQNISQFISRFDTLNLTEEFEPFFQSDCILESDFTFKSDSNSDIKDFNSIIDVIPVPYCGDSQEEPSQCNCVHHSKYQPCYPTYSTWASEQYMKEESRSSGQYSDLYFNEEAHNIRQEFLHDWQSFNEQDMYVCQKAEKEFQFQDIMEE